MGEHSWVRVIAGASALQVPPPVTHPSPASRPAQGIPAKIPPMPQPPPPPTSACGTTSRGAPPHADLRLDQSPGAHLGRGPLRMLRRRLLLGRPRIKGHWRWTTSCPGTRAVRTTSTSCRHSASPMPIQVRCFQRRGSWRPCRAITRISVPCSRK